ncbi:MAG: DUF3341 domain-containing protein [Chloroflexaceae bacterium]|jgi:hypothetical protein|nr:DUF3341 domain-containing protein [Chloroflexaceae bacterium]
MQDNYQVYGLVAEFETSDQLLAAARATKDAGYRKVESYTPFAVEGLNEALGQRKTRLPWLVLVGGLLGAATGFLMQTIASVYDYPWLVAGRPYFSWQAFVPITFEMTILLAAGTAVFGMLLLNHLPRHYHPIFNTPGFKRASVDRFFLAIEAADPRYNPTETTEFLRGLNPLRVSEVGC